MRCASIIHWVQTSQIICYFCIASRPDETESSDYAKRMIDGRMHGSVVRIMRPFSSVDPESWRRRRNQARSSAPDVYRSRFLVSCRLSLHDFLNIRFSYACKAYNSSLDFLPHTTVSCGRYCALGLSVRPSVRPCVSKVYEYGIL